MTPAKVLALDLDNLDEDDIEYLHWLRTIAQRLIIQKYIYDR